MEKPVKKIIFILFIVFFISIVFFVIDKAKMLWLSSKDAAVSSTVASLLDSLYQNQVHLTDLLGFPNNDWQALSDDEYDRVITKLNEIKPQSFDAKNWKPGLVLVDYWNHRLKIAFRKGTDKNIYEFIVWSSGRDGISRTEDDVVLPWESKVPVIGKSSQ